MTTGFPINHAENLVGIGLVEAGSELIEDGQSGFSVAAGLAMAATGEVDLRLV